jgi:hypothetical protein
MNSLFEKGREGFLDGTLDWDTNTFKIALLDLDGATGVAVKAVSGATNTTPITLTVTANGFSNGDIVVVAGLVGTTSANNIWKVVNKQTNSIDLVSIKDGVTNSVGNGAYVSGGYVVCMGPSSSGDNYDDYSNCNIGTPQTLTSPTVASGVADAADVTFTSVTGNSVEALIIYKDTGTPSTSRIAAFIDGKHLVTCNTQAAATATTIAVEPLVAAIANGQILVFSNGASATLSVAANAGDRSLTVTALAALVSAGSYATAVATGSGLPVVPNGGNITVTFDNGPNRIFKL